MSDGIELLKAKVKMLVAALRMCKMLLDALRLDSNIGSYLQPFEKAAFEQTDMLVTKTLDRVEIERSKL